MYVYLAFLPRDALEELEVQGPREQIRGGCPRPVVPGGTHVAPGKKKNKTARVLIGSDKDANERLVNQGEVADWFTKTPIVLLGDYAG